MPIAARSFILREGVAHYLTADGVGATLESVGERLTFGLFPEELPGFLACRGFGLESDVGAAEYHERYFGEAARGMRGHEFHRVALARVLPHPGRATTRRWTTSSPADERRPPRTPAAD